MASNDREGLRSQLAALGYNAGPITDTTRPVYVKKLRELSEMKKTNCRNSMQPKSLNSRSLLTFSSDESDLDSIDDADTARKLRRRNRLSLPDKITNRNKNSANLKPPNAQRNPNVNVISNCTRSGSKKWHFPDNSETDSDYHENARRSSRNRKTNHSPSLKGDSSVISDGKIHYAPNKTFTMANGHREMCFSRSSHLISMILLSFVVLFFVAIGVMYVSVRKKDGDDSEHLPVASDAVAANRLRESRKLVVLNRLRNKLRQTAGVYDCASDREGVKRNMLLTEIERFTGDLSDVSMKKEDVKSVVFQCLEIFLKHPDFGIRLYNSSNEPLVDRKVFNAYSIESISGDKSFACRLRQACGLILYKLLLVLFVLAAVVASAFIVYWHWLKQKRFRDEMLTLIENIMNLLQNHDRMSLDNPDAKGLPLPHVRDMLIPLAERKPKKDLWEAAVKFIDDNDSRVRTEIRNIDGEEYKVWRWIQQSSPVRTDPAKKSWQGQAFEHSDGGTNSPPVSLTSCLKVRNMFDPEMEYGDDWHLHIRDAVLEKCQRLNAIVHVKVDTSSREGCVYVKCVDSEKAGHVFRQLHGWWFDGKLITVRYLRLERYHDRFPNSVYAKVPLKCTNKFGSS